MTANLSTLHQDRVSVTDGLVHIRDLTSSDTDLVALAKNASDVEAAVQRALATGARALAVATASVDSSIVEKSFDTLQARMQAMLTATAGQVTGETTALFEDPDKGVRAALHDWMKGVTAALDNTFDPERAGSALGKLQVVLRDNGESQLAATRRLLNPDADDSPLSRLAGGVRDQISTVLEAVARLAEQVSAERAATAATRAALERSAVKGLDFEELAGAALCGIASIHGDVYEPVGRTTGATGGRVGDHIVEVRGGSGRYIVECKDRAVSVRAILDELDRAAANREAAAAIAVFSSAAHCPTPEPLTIFDNRVLVVYDKDDQDTTALRVACAWVRALTSEKGATGSGDVPLEVIRRHVEEAVQALGRVSTIRRAHTAAARKINEAGEHLTTLAREVSDALKKVESPVSALSTSG